MRQHFKRGAVVASLLALLLFGAGCALNTGGDLSESARMQHAAASFLWKQQAASGGWHSQTHRILKGGQALTPFILFTLLESDQIPASHAPQMERGLDFIRRHTSAEGVLGLADSMIIEYPNYATAYALRLLLKYGSAADEPLIEAMRQYLMGQQFGKERGVERTHPAFGGWGFGERGLPDGAAGYVDLSHTRRVLQALYQSDEPGASTMQQVQVFLKRLQKMKVLDKVAADTVSGFDGGFYYSPVVFLANKGGVLKGNAREGPPVFRSYATATCDGILALLASGVERNDPRLESALNWLRVHADLAYPEGMPLDAPAGWHRVMQLYHLAVRAEVYHVTGWPEGAREDMLNYLKRHRRADGAFINKEGSPNKEDDPLLATALALSALHFINAP